MVLVALASRSEALLTREDILKSSLNIRSVQRRSLDERQIVFGCSADKKEDIRDCLKELWIHGDVPTY